MFRNIKNIKKFIFLALFLIFSSSYFWYSFNVFIPKKSVDIANYFISNEASRHILKVSILSEKGFRFYRESLTNKNEDRLYDAIDLTSSAEGFITSFSFDNVKNVPELKLLIRKNVEIMEKNLFNINKKDLDILFSNVSKISKMVQVIEMYKYNTLVEGIISREKDTYTIIIFLVYLSISIVLLIILTLIVLYKNKDLEEKNLKQQKILLTQSKIAALGDILVNIAHQWRQPLSAITTSVSALKLYVDLGKEVSDDSIRQCSDDVLEQAAFLSKTIDDFREFIKEDSIICKKYILRTIFSKLQSLVKDMFADNSIQLFIQVDEQLEINVNDNILIQAFINLCYNSKDAFVDNKISYENRYFFIKAYKEDNNLLICFTDSAGGIDEKIMDKIFEPYFTTKHQARGTGIGLYRTNQIITQHFSGSITSSNVEYEFDGKNIKGVKFTISLPFD